MKNWRFKLLGLPLFEIRSSEDIENPSVSLNSPEAIDILFDGQPNKINHDTALTYSAVWRAVTLLSGIIAYLPKQVLREEPEGNINDKSHPFYWLLHSEPNQRDTSFKYFENAAQHLLLWGNHLSVIKRDKFYNVVSLEQIKPNDFDVAEVGGQIWYKIKGYDKPLPSTDVIHVKGFGDGLKGKDPITVARESMQLGLTYNQTANKLFENGHLNDIYLSVPGALTDKQFTSIKDSFEKKYIGAKNTGRPAVLPGGTEIKSISTTPENMQFLESRKFHISEIARWFGVPPHKLADLERSTNNNIEHQAIEFVTDTVMLWTERIEQEYSRKLFTETEKRTYSIEFNLNGLLRGDLKTRAEYYNKATGGRPWMTPDEIRRLENQKQLGGDASELITPLNFKAQDNNPKNNEQ